MARILPAVFLCLLAGCVAPAPQPEAPPGHQLHRLYLGRGMADGEVTTAQWEEFLRLKVTPRFPDGLTHWETRGQWRGESEALVKENAYILEVIVPPEDRAAAEASLRNIIDAYKEQFGQESVLWMRDDVSVDFR